MITITSPANNAQFTTAQDIPLEGSGGPRAAYSAPVIIAPAGGGLRHHPDATVAATAAAATAGEWTHTCPKIATPGTYVLTVVGADGSSASVTVVIVAAPTPQPPPPPANPAA